MLPVEDNSTASDKMRSVEFMNFVMYGGHWRIYLVVDSGAQIVRVNMANKGFSERTPGRLIISEGASYVQPSSYDANGIGLVRLQPYESINAMRTLEIDAMHKVNIGVSGLTVGAFLQFIMDRYMEDFEYVDGLGCRFWCINVLAELEKAGHVPVGSTKRFVEYIQERHRTLPDRVREDTAVGHFNQYCPIWMPK